LLLVSYDDTKLYLDCSLEWARNELFDYSCWFDADQNGFVCMVYVNT